MNRNSLLPISGIVALIALVGVAIFSQEPLKGIRPAIEKVPGASEKIDARLWQDPFRAVLDQLKTDGGDFKAYGSVLPKKFRTNKNSTVLAIMVPGAPYAEEREIRLRWRYAVLAALRGLTYSPDDGEHIRLLAYDNGCACMTRPSMSNIVPYETYSSKRFRESPVLLVWVSESVLRDDSKPLSGLNKLFSHIGLKNRRANEGIIVIGPSSSTGLRNMLVEASTTSLHFKNKLRIYSPSATMEEIFLPSPAPVDHKDQEFGYTAVSPSTVCDFNRDGECRNVTISRTIGTDFALAQSLVKELNMRHCLGDDGHVAIISEWDTDYGRHIFDTFRNSLYAELSDFHENDFLGGTSSRQLYEKIAGDHYEGNPASAEQIRKRDAIGELNGLLRVRKYYEILKKGKKQQDKDFRWPLRLMASKTSRYPEDGRQLTDDHWQMIKGLNRMLLEDVYDAPNLDRRIHRFSYLRGIDGIVPGEIRKGDGQPDGKDKKEVAEVVPIGMLENPVGKSQYDYLRRLADKIYEEDRTLKRNGERGITAIGILGSDFYDKYLVLQAVRQRMPDSVFFTTDLDARYLQADNLKWTKNLVVASHFGFELRKKADKGPQDDVPPFRDSYQTSVFYATLKAFDNKAKGQADLSTGDTYPRIYEIGRMHAIDLAKDDYIAVFVAKKWPYLVLFPLLVAWLLAYSSSRLQEYTKKHWRAMACMALLAAPVACVMYAVFKDEPLSLWEGVSIWPTEILRLFSAGLSIFLLLRMRHLMTKNRHDLEGRFFTKKREWEECSERPKIPDTILTHVASLCRMRGLNLGKFTVLRHEEASQKNGTSTADMDKMWREYSDFGKPRCRRTRTLISMLLFLAVALTWMSFFEPPVTPLRGTSAFYADKIILLFSVSTFLWLTFLVVDVTRLCAQLLRQLALAKPFWSTESSFGGAPDVVDNAKDIYGEWLLVDFVARHTDVLQKFIFYPIIVWLVLFLARSQFFDNWQTPVNLLLIISLSAVYAWSCVLRLRKAAEGLRDSVKKRLERELDKELMGGTRSTAARVEVIKHVAKKVEDIKIGAFVPLSQHPLVHSALAAVGGIGGTTLLQFLDFFNM